MHNVIQAGMYLVLAFILVWELLALSAFALDSGLERIHVDPDGTLYINSRTMVNPDRNTFSFWSTIVPVKGGAYYTRTVTVLQKARKNPLRLEYVQSLQEINCSTRNVNTSSVLFYDKKDRIVHTVNVPGWAQEIEGSRPEVNRLLAAVCGPKIAQLMGE